MKTLIPRARRVLAGLAAGAVAFGGLAAVAVMGAGPASADTHNPGDQWLDIGGTHMSMHVSPIVDGKHSDAVLFEVGQKMKIEFTFHNHYGHDINDVQARYMGAVMSDPAQPAEVMNRHIFAQGGDQDEYIKGGLTCSDDTFGSYVETTPMKPDDEVICTTPEFTLTNADLGTISWTLAMTAPDAGDESKSFNAAASFTSLHGVDIAETATTHTSTALTPVRAGSPAQIGDKAVFTFTVTDGTTIGVANLAAKSALGLAYTCTPESLPPSRTASATCVSSPYTVTATDAAAGKFAEAVSFTGTSDAGFAVTSGAASPEVPVVQAGNNPPATDLLVQKTASVKTVNPGDKFTYTVNVTNLSSVAASNVVISDTLPDQVDYVSSTPGITSYDAKTRTVTMSVPTLGPKASVQFDIVVQVKNNVAAGTKIINKVSTSQAGGCDPNSTTGCAGSNEIVVGSGGGGAAMARTGADVGPFVGVGAVLLVVGLAAVALGTRRSRNRRQSESA